MNNSNALKQNPSLSTDSFETIASNAVIVIHPGSLNFRIGKASDSFPLSVPHCIAWRNKQDYYSDLTDPCLKRYSNFSFNELVNEGIADAEDTLAARQMDDGHHRKVTSHSRLYSENVKSTPVIANQTNCANEVLPEKLQNFVVGEQALKLDSSAHYTLRWPLRFGRFNIHSGTGGTLTSVMADLEAIWTTIISRELDIPIKDLPLYRAIVVVSDTMSHHHMKSIMDLLLNRLKFGAAILHQESVCASYGAGISTACVVDVGEQKTSVSCVEDGISLKHTRIHLDFGGRDVGRALYHLLRRAGVPLPEYIWTSYRRERIFQQIKEQFTHLDQSTQGIYEHTISIPGESDDLIQYQVKVGDEAILAPLSLFFPHMFGLDGSEFIHAQASADPDPDDPYGEYFLRQTQRCTQETKYGRKKEISDLQMLHSVPEAGGGDDDSCDVPDNLTVADTLKFINGVEDDNSDDEQMDESDDDAELQLMGIDEAIISSIEKCESEDKKRMYSCILVVGGGAMFPGAMSWLQYRIWSLMSSHARSGLEVMDVINKPKDLDPRMICWKGAALMVSLDTTQELWVRHREWNQDGVRVLREKTPFMW